MRHHPGTERHMTGSQCRQAPGAPCINAPPPRNRAPHDREPVPASPRSTLYQCATTPQQRYHMTGSRCRQAPGAPCINAPPPRNRVPHDREPVSASPRSTLYQCATTPQQRYHMTGSRSRRSPGSPCINAPPPHNVLHWRKSAMVSDHCECSRAASWEIGPG